MHTAQYTALALLFALLWASGFVAIKISLRDAPPLVLMASRFLIAGVLLLGWARLRGLRFPTSVRDWGRIATIGVLNNALYLGLTSLLLQHISAGMGSVLASTNPLMLALLAPWLLDERLTVRKAAGLLTSYVGVAWTMWSRVGRDNEGWAMALWFGCILFFVAATILFKRWQLRADLAVVNGGQALAAGLVLTPPALLVHSLDGVQLTASLLASHAWMIFAVSLGAMWLWLRLLQAGDATRASAWFFLNPVLGLFMAALVLGEPLGPHDFLAGVLVAAGIYLVQREAIAQRQAV